ncbi:TolC family protein [Herbaspirillum chlorophenolicum]|uniref:TolC family protein n=1 Tax=Herbaspirillum chlorophenolicum TaxID=211589 RepID=UPI00067AF67A|nr:TolC family protein [Herbaspirillum chlorophenolicum]
MLVAALLLAGCGSVGVQPYSEAELATRTAADRAAAQQDVPPITAPLTLEEAIARALKYNLDRRVKMMEEALALNQLDTATWDMLPRFMAQAGYSRRNKDLITNSVDSVTGQPSLAHPYVSSDRAHTTYDLGLTWNLLDFGLSYIAAKQQADRVLIAAERRRKAMHLLVQDVVSAFWRTASAQKLNEQVTLAIINAESALEDARRAESERVRSPIDALRYQRQLLENLRLLENIDQELSVGRLELAQLMNAPLDMHFRVVEPDDRLATPLLGMPMRQMEELAMTHNADIREQQYSSRIAVEETKRTMLKLFPNLSFNAGIRHDSDRYMINNTWNETGMQLSYNIFNLLAAPSQKRFAEAGVKLADQRRIATQMTVLAQVYLSRLQYEAAYRQYLRSDEIWHADEKIAEHSRNREMMQTQSRLEQVSNNAAAIVSLLRRYQSMAQVQNMRGKLQATLGMEPDIGSVNELSLEQLTKQVGDAMQQWQDGAAVPPATDAAAAAAAK